MYENNHFSHTDLNGKSPLPALIADCLDFIVCGENITKDYKSAKSAHKALMKSRGHKRNILNDEFKEMGVSCFKNYCVELFVH